MFRVICLLFLFNLSVNVCHLNAQQPNEKTMARLETFFQEQYGPDQFLVNGVRYYNTHTGCTGHKFFGNNEYTRGKLILENKKYHDVFLKYNLYDQQLILQHLYKRQIYYEIILSNSRIREFELEEKLFRKCYFPCTDTLFFQVLEEGDLACYYHWSKVLIPTKTETYWQGEFSGQKRTSYLLKQSTLYEFKGARSFARVFGEDKSLVLKYIRKRKIRIKKTEDAEMMNLIRECNRITGS